MLLSVIIPTCNRLELLKKCIERLHPSVQSLTTELYQVIITDDSSNNISAEFIKEHFTWIKCVAGPGRGPAANRNNGAKYAKGEWLVFLDDDCLPDKNLLNEYVKMICNNQGVLAFEGSIFPDDVNLLKKDLAECPVNTEGGCFWSANICVNADLFNKIGGFDENFLIAAQEDQELYIRIQQQASVLFCKTCVVVHPVRYRTLKQKIKHIPVEIKNWIFFARKYNSWTQIFVYGLKAHVKACIRTGKELKFRLLLYHLTAIFYLVPGMVFYAIQNRNRSLK